MMYTLNSKVTLPIRCEYFIIKKQKVIYHSLGELGIAGLRVPPYMWETLNLPDLGNASEGNASKSQPVILSTRLRWLAHQSLYANSPCLGPSEAIYVI
jgi:hypothetical protein